jgi:hypothetical protein
MATAVSQHAGVGGGGKGLPDLVQAARDVPPLRRGLFLQFFLQVIFFNISLA